MGWLRRMHAAALRAQVTGGGAWADRVGVAAAIDAGACVRPVAIALRLPDGRRAPAAYAAEGTWWEDVCPTVPVSQSVTETPRPWTWASS